MLEKWWSDLPNFRRFRDEGFLGQHLPPIPAQTPVAWTSFLTGMNPGKHGVFSFLQRRMGMYDREVISSEKIKSETIFQILSKYGKRVGAINVPMSTFSEVNGFMIPGFLAKEEGIPHPPELRNDLREKFGLVNKFQGDLDVDTLVSVKEKPDLFWNKIEELTTFQRNIVSYLLKEENWDFFMTVFMATDRINHFFWKYLDETHPLYSESQFKYKAKNFYRKIDKIIGEFIEIVPRNTLTILLSDHGFCQVHKELVVNNYLEKKDFTTIYEGKVDVRQSKAVAYGYGDIWLNVRGREPNGVIDKTRYEETRKSIIDFLQQLNVDGKKPVKKVVRKEEIYWGPHVEESPDLVIFFNSGWQASRKIEAMKKKPDERYVIDNPMWSGGHDGTHDPSDVKGIIGILGSKKISKNIRREIRLWEVAPTILESMNLPVPQQMDGNPLQSTDI